jgi:hypothetical protein
VFVLESYNEATFRQPKIIGEKTDMYSRREKYLNNLTSRVGNALSNILIGKLRRKVGAATCIHAGLALNFFLKGLQKVRIEWKITATAHNLLKIIREIKRIEGPAPAMG